jgi:transcriptional regulator with XRE-family HTH domain
MDLKNVRKKLGLSQSEFAKKIGYSASLIRQIEQGQWHITDRMERIIQTQFPNLKKE